MNDGKAITSLSGVGAGRLIISQDGNTNNYDVRDYIRRNSKFKSKGTGGVEWLAAVVSVDTAFGPDSTTRTIVLADQTLLQFDITTGELIQKSRDTLAMNFLEAMKHFKKTLNYYRKNSKDYARLTKFFNEDLSTYYDKRSKEKCFYTGALSLKNSKPLFVRYLLNFEYPSDSFYILLNTDSLNTIAQKISSHSYFLKKYPKNSHWITIEYDSRFSLDTSTLNRILYSVDSLINSPTWSHLTVREKSSNKRWLTKTLENWYYYNHEAKILISKKSKEMLTTTVNRSSSLDVMVYSESGDSILVPYAHPSEDTVEMTYNISDYKNYMSHPTSFKYDYVNRDSLLTERFGIPDDVYESKWLRIWYFKNSYYKFLVFWGHRLFEIIPQDSIVSEFDKLNPQMLLDRHKK